MKVTGSAGKAACHVRLLLLLLLLLLQYTPASGLLLLLFASNHCAAVGNAYMYHAAASTPLILSLRSKSLTQVFVQESFAYEHAVNEIRILQAPTYVCIRLHALHLHAHGFPAGIIR